MGLDFCIGTPEKMRHVDARWSYSGFHRFRARLAGAIGVKLESMRGFGRGEFARPWSEIDDGLVPLLRHSDCEGEMTPEECATVATNATTFGSFRATAAEWREMLEKDFVHHRAGNAVFL